jgi:hypothetical protein
MTATLEDVEAEAEVLGALLVSEPAVQRVREVGLRVEDFYLDRNRLVYAAVLRLQDAGEPVDQLTVKAELERRVELEAAGGANRLDVLAGQVKAPGNVKAHANRLAELSHQRRVREAVDKVDQRLKTGAALNGEVSELAETLLDLRVNLHDTVELLDLDGLRSLSPPKWLVRNHVVAGGLNLLYGKPGAGKSFVALDWALSVATGEPWLGNKVESGAVVYVAAEGAAGLRNRALAWLEFHGVEDLDRFWVWPRPVNFYTGDTAELEAKLNRLPEAPVLIVCDTVARCFAGGNENETQDMTLFVDHVDRVRNRYGAAALLVHHPQKKNPEEPRGNSALDGAIDTSRLLKVDGKTRSLVAKKTKDWLDPDPVNFALESLERSAVIRPRTVRDGSGRLESETEQVLATVRGRFRTVWVPSAELREASKLGRTVFYDTVKRLVDEKKLEVRRVGAQRREYRLIEDEPTVRNRPQPSARTADNRPSVQPPLKGGDGGQSPDEEVGL